MNTRDAPAGMDPPVELEGEGVPLDRPAAPESGGGAADPWRDFAAVAALMAVWHDLSIDVRRRIACDAMIAMSDNKPRDEPLL